MRAPSDEAFSRQRAASAGVSSPLAEPGEVRHRGAEKEAQPYALAPAEHANAVHSVVPVAFAHEGQSVRADGERACEGAATVLEQRACLWSHDELRIPIMLVGPQRGCRQKRDGLVQNGRVASSHRRSARSRTGATPCHPSSGCARRDPPAGATSEGRPLPGTGALLRRGCGRASTAVRRGSKPSRP